MFVFTCYYRCPRCGEGHTGCFWYRSEQELTEWWMFTFGTLLTVLQTDDVTWLDPEAELNGTFVGGVLNG